MRYQLRLVGEDLYAFYQQLSRRCWSVLAPLLPEADRWGAYRSLRRRLKAALTARVEAREYCGQAHHCDAFLSPVEPGQRYRKSVPGPEAEHTNRYLLTSTATPGQLVGELSRECLRILAEVKAGAKIKGAGRQVHRAVREVLKDHLYRNESCGETPLCGLSEPINPWVRHSMKGAVQFAGEPRSGRAV